MWVYFNIRNTFPKSGTFLLGHPVYIHIYIYISLRRQVSEFWLKFIFFSVPPGKFRIVPEIDIFSVPAGKFRIVPQVRILFLISPWKMSKFVSNSYFFSDPPRICQNCASNTHIFSFSRQMWELCPTFLFQFQQANVGIVRETGHGHFQSPQHSTLHKLS